MILLAKPSHRIVEWILTYLISGQLWTVITSPCLTRKLWRTTRFIRAEPSSRSSSANTIKMVSFRFLPFTRTVSPRNSWRVSMVLCERAIIELSSLTASVTLNRVSIAREACNRLNIHEGVWLFLLLENGGGRGIDLWRVSKSKLSKACGDCYIFVLSTRWISVRLLAAISRSEGSGKLAYFDRSTLGWV